MNNNKIRPNKNKRGKNNQINEQIKKIKNKINEQ